jgi:hypothetical protein
MLRLRNESKREV